MRYTGDECLRQAGLEEIFRLALTISGEADSEARFKSPSCGGEKCVSDSSSSRKDPLHDPRGRIACGSVLVLTTRLPMSRGVKSHEGVLTRPLLRREA
jgi:hypothetical protein